jgi:uncharacterized SAM-binding protein YcdF (DUF218 family)
MGECAEPGDFLSNPHKKLLIRILNLSGIVIVIIVIIIVSFLIQVKRFPKCVENVSPCKAALIAFAVMQRQTA